ncbi:hypothetical protein O6H91_12G038600 [Diphasiastrum complanatum]|uniref:Uncharacterized protein n=4 Tax=Diphasiastrum complanatum TaxID=34168 RepID=A0ACC2C0I1_DIPCM|nr:hypothetical protein O6H91_12G038600 [Diphasiastrum complanatum]KAJ7535555.1 hypothetical protein O6H91_12G038600 [Diphasiastrum complanatum]KAJ7535556.1 hypothetical protein O6H91_12G038600 [Diphasiastrum complanatum]KAJ7535557.1 hypothetical protein O6H91_12G038600 [Diphasiastrum complanatum]
MGYADAETRTLEIENRSQKDFNNCLEEYDDDGHPRRTGNVWTASAHVITAVVGSGVLSLAWSISQLGWIAGPFVMTFFAFVTYYTSVLLADCYRSPEPVSGKRNHTYMDAVRANLGATQVWICGFVQYSNLWATSVGYTITAAISMVAVKRSNCFHENGHVAACHISNNPYMASFGVLQIIFSQMPDFQRLWWLSIVAAVMSCTYSGIGLALGIAKAMENTHSHGSLTGVSVGHGIDQIAREKKIWQIFQALGNIAFAYSFSAILIEIQDTLKSPPSENKTMKKATLVGVLTTTFFYMTIGCMGYAAFGNNVPGNLLTGFGFYEPYWLVDFANVCIVVHLVGAYQVFTQPLFALIETWASKKWRKSKFINDDLDLKVPIYGIFPVNLFRLTWRTVFVITTTLVAMLLPFFNDIVGLIGAYGFWPLTVYFPISMYINQKKLKCWSSKWVGLQALSMICLLVSIAAALGSVKGIVHALSNYTPFKTRY